MVYAKTPFPYNSLADQELANITKALNLEDGTSRRESEKKTNKSENYHWMVYKQVK